MIAELRVDHLHHGLGGRGASEDAHRAGALEMDARFGEAGEGLSGLLDVVRGVRVGGMSRMLRRWSARFLSEAFAALDASAEVPSSTWAIGGHVPAEAEHLKDWGFKFLVRCDASAVKLWNTARVWVTLAHP